MSGPPSNPRVLLVIDSLVPGGAERSTVDLLPHLRQRGFDLEVASLHDRPGLQDEVAGAGVALHDLSGPGGRMGWIRRLRAVMSDRPPDLVHTTLFQADVCGRTAAFSLRIPVVSSLTTEHYGPGHLEADHLSRTKIRGAQALDAATARMTRRLHAVSTHVADTMARHLRYPRDRIDVVYRGRPVGSPPPDRNGSALPPSGPRVLLVARHEPAKGIDRALAAFPGVLAVHPDARLLVAGRTGAHSPALTAMIDRLGLGDSVELLGHRDDITGLLTSSDVFVLPSRREGLPGALLEAMAAGTPAVVGDLAQVREVVGPDQAVVVDADDPADLASGILATLDDRVGAARRAALARQRFLTTFTLDRSADAMAAFYRRSLDPGGGSR